MDNQTSIPKQESGSELQTNEQETIFKGSEFSLKGYDKSIKNARLALFAVAAMQVLFGIIIGVSQGGDGALYTIVISIIVAAIFIALGLWSKSKPYTAIVTGLIVFVSLHLIEAIFDPSTIKNGIIMKIVVIVYLVKSINDAREAQEMKKNFDNR